ncbi:centrosomal protein of 120 kDa-like [Amphibalanus amphitrite]|uniref:centrosomal protein of 120 kDa-like n=1 Tax=Amphibalanus amphitrite TaxID=1232801 RepID=UPI001C92AA08|nr:centrosomal protein of 120 kDa-like [Amphibalanus amphitrite]
MSEDILLVLSIFEGRHLPSPPGFSVLAEAKFDYQILQSDPVPLTSQPDFNTELVWETDRKSLQQYRMHKSPVKVEFYASADGSTDLRQLLGYVVLDTRSAREKAPGADAEAKWHRMLGCRPKSPQELPSVQLGLSLEPNIGPPPGNSVLAEGTIDLAETTSSAADGEPEQRYQAAGDSLLDRDLSSLAHSPPTRGPAGRPAAPPSAPPSAPPLVPVLDERLGCFQLGPPTGPQEMFKLTVIVVYAQHLQLLIPPGVDLPSSSGFNFYYSLLNCDICTEPFHNIVQPSFLAERAVTRIRCRLPVLRQYLEQLESIDFHLCCGDLSLGSAAVPISPFASDLAALPSKPLVHEAAHPLVSSLSGRVPRDPSGAHAPAVGITVELTHARVSGDGQSQLSGGDATPREAPPATAAAAPPPPPAPPVDSTIELDDTAATTDGARVESTLALDTSGLSSDAGSPEVATVRRAAPVAPAAPMVPAAAAAAPPSAAPSATNPAPVTAAPATPRSAAEEMPDRAGAEDSRSRHYRCVLDLRELCLQEPSRGRAVLRFTYPHFGDQSQLSSGAVRLPCRQAATVPRGIFEFNFAATAGWLRATLRRFPVVVRAEMEGGQVLGTAHVPLHPVLQQKRVYTTSSLGVRGFQQNHYSVTDVLDTAGAVVGELTVAMSLDDLGEVADPPPPPPTQLPRATGPTVAPPDDRDEKLERDMYAAARELEEWKQEQKLLFQNQLQQREASHLAILTEEWKRRDAERELQLQNRLREAVALEDKLRGGLTALEEHQQRLEQREEELTKVRAQLQAEHQQIAGEVRSLTAEMEAECQKRVREEQQKAADAEAASRRLREDVAELERKLAELQTSSSRTPADPPPPPSSVTAELERRLEAANKSKLYYKQRWVETARELEERRAADTRRTREMLEREKLELDRLRAQVSARDEFSFLSEERRQVEELRGQVRALTPRDPPLSDRPLTPGSSTEQLRRLREERRVLLDTGLYTDSDAAVRELDRRITQLAAPVAAS